MACPAGPFAAMMQTERSCEVRTRLAAAMQATAAPAVLAGLVARGACGHVLTKWLQMQLRSAGARKCSARAAPPVPCSSVLRCKSQRSKAVLISLAIVALLSRCNLRMRCPHNATWCYITSYDSQGKSSEDQGCRAMCALS